MVPVAIAVRFADAPAVAQFVCACLAIIPLAALLGFATEELAKRFGNALSALLNISFGNAAELIIFIIGVVRGELGVVQAAIIGSVLSNLLLILGMAFFLGGLRFTEQYYNNTVTQTTGTLLLLAVVSLAIPAGFHASFRDSQLADDRVLQLSYSTSIILLLVYGAYLFFQLKTHASLYRDVATGPEQTPRIPLVASIILLAVSTALIALIAEFMVASINGLVATTPISEQFVGLILIPVVGNSAEHFTSVMLALKGRIDISLGIALGYLQIVLLVGPLAVIVGWIIGQPLTLFFSLFETLSLLLSVMIVTYMVIDGRSNWLEGVLLMAAYVLFAIAAALYPSASGEA
ncbi:calcium/proton exchanger [Protomyces lactucae-debilis]|uniref:Vacuolar calcium ion transporter n=1 Tax=Protomyces lactucae-debilis TaxID=2754530 RepID=A0A1Y2FFR0_PROLT|nr:calcium/proton exchanger [Protomyces lactucae-debilis]ORY82447.1 calcium/proton exchanger [Protomyces lactucae-debilis]